MPHSGPENAREPPVPLVMVPGTLCDARVFGPLRERLPGVPIQTTETPGGATLQSAAKAVLAAAPRRFALLGFSLGGMVAMEAALLAPQRVCGLALVSTSPLPVPPEHHPRRRAAVQQARTAGMAQFMRDLFCAEYASGRPSSTELTDSESQTLSLLASMAESLGPDVFAQQTEMALGRRDYRAELARLRCPTLVIAGDADRLCPPEAQKALAAALPTSSVVTLPGAGHLALLQCADQVASAVAAWFHTVQRTESDSTRNNATT